MPGFRFHLQESLVDALLDLLGIDDFTLADATGLGVRQPENFDAAVGTRFPHDEPHFRGADLKSDV